MSVRTNKTKWNIRQRWKEFFNDTVLLPYDNTIRRDSVKPHTVGIRFNFVRVRFAPPFIVRDIVGCSMLVLPSVRSRCLSFGGSGVISLYVTQLRLGIYILPCPS